MGEAKRKLWVQGIKSLGGLNNESALRKSSSNLTFNFNEIYK